MEAVFVNEYRRNLALIKELYRYQVFGRSVVKVYFGCVAVAIALSAALAVKVNGLFWIAACCLPLIYLFFFLRYRKAVNTAMKRELENCSLGKSVKVCINNETIEQAGHTCQTISFDEIDYAVSTSDYILLFTLYNTVFPIYKDGFTTGSCQAFCMFLLDHDIELK